MNITDVKVFPVNEEKLKAFVSIILDDCFVVTDIKVIHGNNGLFVSMPSKKRKNGTFRDVAHPLNNDTRRMIEERIFQEYNAVIGDGDGASGQQSSELDGESSGLLIDSTDADYDGGSKPSSDENSASHSELQETAGEGSLNREHRTARPPDDSSRRGSA